MTSAYKPRRLDVATVTGAMLVEHCDIPADMTIGEWRAAAAAERRATRESRSNRRGMLRRALRRH